MDPASIKPGVTHSRAGLSHAGPRPDPRPHCLPRSEVESVELGELLESFVGARRLPESETLTCYIGSSSHGDPYAATIDPSTNDNSAPLSNTVNVYCNPVEIIDQQGPKVV